MVTPYSPSDCWIRPRHIFLYSTTHIGLSIVALPFILMTLWYGVRNRFSFHRRIARLTFPIWLYVSVTGVIVFLLLRHFMA